MKIIVNRDACAGHARCNATAPAIYDLDDDGYSAIAQLDIPSTQDADAIAGAYACPERAITVVADA
jgi:ferredoxin